MSKRREEEEEQTLAEVMLDYIEHIEPVLDAADGVRIKLLRKGWSEDAAETVATKMVESV